MPWSLSVSNIIGCLSDDTLEPSGRKGPAPPHCQTDRPLSPRGNGRFHQGILHQALGQAGSKVKPKDRAEISTE